MLPERTISVSNQAAYDLADRLSQALQGSGNFSVRLTEEELTSYLRLALADTAVQEPTIYITQEGLYGRVEVRMGAQHQLRALLTVSADRAALHVRILSAEIDGHAVPRLALGCSDKVIHALLTDMAWPAQVERIVLGEGCLVIEGTLRTQ